MLGALAGAGRLEGWLEDCTFGPSRESAFSSVLVPDTSVCRLLGQACKTGLELEYFRVQAVLNALVDLRSGTGAFCAEARPLAGLRLERDLVPESVAASRALREYLDKAFEYCAAVSELLCPGALLDAVAALLSEVAEEAEDSGANSGGTHIFWPEDERADGCRPGNVRNGENQAGGVENSRNADFSQTPARALFRSHPGFLAGCFRLLAHFAGARNALLFRFGEDGAGAELWAYLDPARPRLLRTAALALRLAVDEMDGARLLGQALRGRCLRAVERALPSVSEASTFKDLFLSAAAVASRLDLGGSQGFSLNTLQSDDFSAVLALLQAARQSVRADFLSGALCFFEEHAELWESEECAEAALDTLVALASDLQNALEEGRYGLGDAERLCGVVLSAAERGDPGRTLVLERAGPVLRLAEAHAGESRNLRDFLDLVGAL